MFLSDVVYFNKSEILGKVRGYFRRGLNGKVLYVRHHKRKFLQDFQPDVREIPTPEQFLNHITKNRKQWNLSDKSIESLSRTYKNKKLNDRLRISLTSKYPYTQNPYIPDLTLSGAKETVRLRLFPSNEDLEILKTEVAYKNIDNIIKPNDTIFTMHSSTQEWFDIFSEYGIDTREPPNDMNLGKLVLDENKNWIQQRITSNGLYVSPASNNRATSTMVLQIKAKDLSLSLESSQMGYKTPLEGFYGATDAIIKDQIITPEQIVGFAKRGIKGGVIWEPNIINPNSDKIKVVNNEFKYNP